MLWKPLLWIAHHYLSWMPVLALLVLTGGRGDRRPATQLRDGRLEFRPKKTASIAWLVVVVFLAYEATETFLHGQEKPFNLAVAACLGFLMIGFLCSFPGTVIVGEGSMQQVFWFRKNKRLRWETIVEINAGGKSRTVTITGADGTKIVHSSQLADRPRLLQEIKKHCGENLPPEFLTQVTAGSPIK